MAKGHCEIERGYHDFFAGDKHVIAQALTCHPWQKIVSHPLPKKFMRQPPIKSDQGQRRVDYGEWAIFLPIGLIVVVIDLAAAVAFHIGAVIILIIKIDNIGIILIIAVGISRSRF